MTAVIPCFAASSTPSGKRKERVRREYRARERQDGFHCADFHAVHAAHLSGADADRLPLARIDDRIRLHVLTYLPAEQERPHLFDRWLARAFDR